MHSDRGLQFTSGDYQRGLKQHDLISSMSVVGHCADNAYDKDVAILPPDEVASIIASSGFDFPTQFYQAGLIHTFFALRASY